MKRTGNTAKREMDPALYDELIFTWKNKIAEAVFEDKIPNDLILNFDHTTLDLASPSKTAYAKRNFQNAPIANSDDKHQVTGTFTVNLSEEIF